MNHDNQEVGLEAAIL